MFENLFWHISQPITNKKHRALFFFHSLCDYSSHKQPKFQTGLVRIHLAVCHKSNTVNPEMILTSAALSANYLAQLTAHLLMNNFVQLYRNLLGTRPFNFFVSIVSSKVNIKLKLKMRFSEISMEYLYLSKYIVDTNNNRQIQIR